MTKRVAINGFGRMGRLSLRAAWGFHPTAAERFEQPGGAWGTGSFDIVHVNEPNADAELSAHLLAFDSVQGRWPVNTAGDDGTLHVGGKTLTYTQCAAPADWSG